MAYLSHFPGVRCHVPEGTLGMDLTEPATRVAAHGVAVVPGNPRFFGPRAAGHLRLSLATSRAVLIEALERLARGLGPTSRARTARP